MPNTFEFWLEYNNCERIYEQRNLDSTDYDSNLVYVQLQVARIMPHWKLYIAVGGGHVWHGVFDFDSTILGEVNMDLNASEAIWEFYSRYTLEGRDDSHAIEMDILGDEPVSGEGLPDIPFTLAEMVGILMSLRATGSRHITNWQFYNLLCNGF